MSRNRFRGNMASSAIVDVVRGTLLNTFIASDRQAGSVHRLPADPFLKSCHASLQVQLSPEFLDGMPASLGSCGRIADRSVLLVVVVYE